MPGYGKKDKGKKPLTRRYPDEFKDYSKALKVTHQKVNRKGKSDKSEKDQRVHSETKDDQIYTVPDKRPFGADTRYMKRYRPKYRRA